MTAPYRRSAASMDTIVTIEVVSPASVPACVAAVARAFAQFGAVEACCSRFDPDSELRALTARIGERVPVSPLLFEATRFARAVAAASGGAFDPTVGYALERQGFNRNYRTGHALTTALPDGGDGARASYRDIRLDPAARTITLTRPLVLDLGAVAKGLAMDLAARELDAVPNYQIEAGGDVLVRGHNAEGNSWQIGIRHPRQEDAVFTVLAVSDAAVCTSGDYERRAPVYESDKGNKGGGHHLLDPRTDASARAAISVTAIAPTAMAADALSTAAFVLGPVAGIRFLERQGVEGVIVTPTLESYTTHGFARYLQ